MRIRKMLGVLLSVAILLGCIAVLPVNRAQALDYSIIEGKLSTWQYYFCRTLMSIALKDAYDSHAETGKNIFPSITCGQACFEGGICGAPISVIGKNHFAVRAYSYFPGKVYDDDELVVYDSYSDAINIKGQDYVDNTAFWRAYDTWEECIHDHSQMLLTQDKYAAVVSATNYDEAAQAYQDTKYKGAEANYKANLLKRVEGYGFVQLDSVTEDEHGIFGLIMSESNILLDSGESRKLSAYSYPYTSYDCTPEIVWTSSDPAIATVAQDGTVTAVSTGYALITADYGEKEAACVVCVDCNGYVMYGNYALYSRPDSDSDSLGKLLKGQPIHLDGTEPIPSEDGFSYYPATARVSNGRLVSGYVQARRVFVNKPSRLSISSPFSMIRLDPGEEEQVPLTVHAEEMSGCEITWESSNPEVAEIGPDGNLQAVSEGVAVLYIRADGRIALTIPVFVGSPELIQLNTIRANDLRIRPESDKTDNEYGTIRVGTYAWVLEVPKKGWYRVLVYVDGRYYDGYVKNTYFEIVSESSNGPSESSSGSQDVPPESSDPPWEDSSSDDPSGGGESSAYEIPGTVVLTCSTGEVIADDWLNVRSEPSSEAERIARLPRGTQVVILNTVEVPEEPVFKTWYHIRADHDGSPVEGYAAADYIQFTGTTEIELEDEPTDTARFKIDEEFVFRIPAGTTVSELAEGLGRTVLVTRKGNPVDEGKPVATGDEVQFFIGRIAVYTRKAAVSGDVDGNGAVNAADYIQMKRHVLGTYVIQGPGYRAGCVAGKGAITASDYLMIKRVVLGTYRLPA
ncbi:MAG: SH3 domain-containing protein [Clostridia bacterium]|nr:SH3 domain-containing protein [Clostridia bacterium]